jgi:hypothetical protein
MAAPIERWRANRPYKDLKDVDTNMSDLERILKLLVVRVEEEDGGGGGGAPDDAEYIVGSPHAGLSAERSLVNGVNTTVDYGTPGQVSIDAVGGSGAPDDAEYLVASADAGLSAEKVFQDGDNTTFATTGSTAQVNVPDASTTAKGAVELAMDGEVAAGLAVQANDSRLTAAGLDPVLSQYHPDRPPFGVSPAAILEEYTADSHHITWRWANQDVATETLEMDTALLDSGDTTGTTATETNVRYFDGVAAGNDFVLTTKLSTFVNINNASSGLILLMDGSEASPSQFLVWQIGGQSTGLTLRSAATYNSTSWTTLLSLAYRALEIKEGLYPVWLQMRYTASDLTLRVYVSLDGYTWDEGGSGFTLANHPTSSHGIHVSASGSAIPANVLRARFYYVRERTDAAGLAGQVGA